MLAASTASALPSSNTSAMCSKLPAPPLATTGTPTDSLTRRVMTKSNPAFVPSASMLFKTISPAPSDTARFAHFTASSPVGLRAPCEKTPHLSGAIFLASIETTMHWLPNFSAPARIKSGFASAEELMLILSAPARSIVNMSSTDFMPPPRGSGAWDAVHHRRAAVGGGGDVEEHHFIRALFVVTQCEFHRVADVAQFARFGLAELDAARDFAVMHVEARNDSFGDHRAH